MGRVITIASGKGGTGKTFLTANLGIALAQMGKSVLLIDADIAMANLSLLLGMQSSPITLHDVLLGEASINDAVYEGPEGIELIPSGLGLESYRRIDSERIKSVISNVKEKYDFILLDAGAGIEKNVLSALSAAQQVLLITEPTPPSIADCLKTKNIAQKVGANPIGIVTNKVHGEKGEITKAEIMETLELPSYGEIPYDIEVRKSFYEKRGEPIIIRKPISPASKAIKLIAEKIIGKELPEEGEERTIEEKKESIFKRILRMIFKK